MKRAAIEPFAMSLLNNVDDNVRTNAYKIAMDNKFKQNTVLYKLDGTPTKIHGITIESVLFTEDFESIIVAGHKFSK